MNNSSKERFDNILRVLNVFVLVGVAWFTYSLNSRLQRTGETEARYYAQRVDLIAQYADSLYAVQTQIDVAIDNLKRGGTVDSFRGFPIVEALTTSDEDWERLQRIGDFIRDDSDKKAYLFVGNEQRHIRELGEYLSAASIYYFTGINLAIEPGDVILIPTPLFRLEEFLHPDTTSFLKRFDLRNIDPQRRSKNQSFYDGQVEQARTRWVKLEQLWLGFQELVRNYIARE